MRCPARLLLPQQRRRPDLERNHPARLLGIPGVTYSETLCTIQGLAVDPFQPNIIYVSFSNDKFRSQDYGQTFWRVYRE